MIPLEIFHRPIAMLSGKTSVGWAQNSNSNSGTPIALCCLHAWIVKRMRHACMYGGSIVYTYCLVRRIWNDQRQSSLINKHKMMRGEKNRQAKKYIGDWRQAECRRENLLEGNIIKSPLGYVIVIVWPLFVIQSVIRQQCESVSQSSTVFRRHQL